VSTQPGRKKKRFLAPQEKYEIWMQLVRGEASVAEAAERARVDRATIAKQASERSTPTRRRRACSR